MDTKMLQIADEVLDWYNERWQHETTAQELRQLQVDRDAQLKLLIEIKTCGCGRCGR